MQATIWSLVAALVAVGCEYTYRAWPAPWTNVWHFVLFVIAQSFVGFCVYKILNAPGATLLSSFVIWSFATVLMRCLVTVFVLDEKVATGTWIAVGLLFVARVTQHFIK